MVTITLGVHDPERLEAVVYVPNGSLGGGFISLKVGALTSIHLGGYDRAGVADARALATSLLVAADALELALDAQAKTDLTQLERGF